MRDSSENLYDRPQVHVEFVIPPADLAPYVSTLYFMEVRGGAGASVEDYLHPEWANLRFQDSAAIDAAIGDADPVVLARRIVVGPTSCATYFRARPGKTWGVGLLPCGWTRFTGWDASEYSDRVVALPSSNPLAGLGDDLFGDDRSVESAAALLVERLRSLPRHADEDDSAIRKAHSALVEADSGSVAALAEASGMSQRTLERFSRRVFGFPPKLLLRRQRFLRSLGKFMLDPSLAWLDTLDWQYHDQAHFLRDFRRFMGMKPSDYAALDHPILMAAAKGRMAAAGAPVQALHRPA